MCVCVCVCVCVCAYALRISRGLGMHWIVAPYKNNNTSLEQKSYAFALLFSLEFHFVTREEIYVFAILTFTFHFCHCAELCTKCCRSAEVLWFLSDSTKTGICRQIWLTCHNVESHGPSHGSRFVTYGQKAKTNMTETRSVFVQICATQGYYIMRYSVA
jgi:hypothetical protein